MFPQPQRVSYVPPKHSELVMCPQCMCSNIYIYIYICIYTYRYIYIYISVYKIDVKKWLKLANFSLKSDLSEFK